MVVKFMSPEQILANQKNAQNSTGPRTPEGKDKCSRNAIKHGLLAKGVVINSPTGAEDRADFDALLTDLCEELKPRGFIEETLVERIATCYWRLHRAQRFEAGAVRESLENDTDKPDELGKFADQLSRAEKALSAMERLAVLLAKKAPDLTPADNVEIQNLARKLPESHLEHAVHEIYAVPSPIDVEGLRIQLPGLRVKHLETIEQLREQWKHAQEQLALYQSRRALVGSLPSDGPLLKLIRYETMLDRQIYRALNEFRRHRERGPLSEVS